MPLFGVIVGDYRQANVAQSRTACTTEDEEGFERIGECHGARRSQELRQ